MNNDIPGVQPDMSFFLVSYFRVNIQQTRRNRRSRPALTDTWDHQTMQQMINILFAVPDFGGDLIVRIQLLPP